MIDITAKKPSVREAIAEATVILKAAVARAIRANKVPKGDVLASARLAGIFAAKKTAELIPLCHPIPVEYTDVQCRLRGNSVVIRAVVRTEAKTGVEMEALTAASVAALTVYDMCKPLDKGMVISGIKLLKKTGGKSGTYTRK